MDSFLILSILLVVAVFGYFFYNRHKQNKALAERLKGATRRPTPDEPTKKEADSIDRP